MNLVRHSIIVDVSNFIASSVHELSPKPRVNGNYVEGFFIDVNNIIEPDRFFY